MSLLKNNLCSYISAFLLCSLFTFIPKSSFGFYDNNLVNFLEKEAGIARLYQEYDLENIGDPAMHGMVYVAHRDTKLFSTAKSKNRSLLFINRLFGRRTVSACIDGLCTR